MAITNKAKIQRIGIDYRALHKHADDIYHGDSNYDVGLRVIHGEDEDISYYGGRLAGLEISRFHTVSRNPEIFTFEIPASIDIADLFFMSGGEILDREIERDNDV